LGFARFSTSARGWNGREWKARMQTDPLPAFAITHTSWATHWR
jgi:hypothetical protein